MSVSIDVLYIEDDVPQFASGAVKVPEDCSEIEWRLQNAPEDAVLDIALPEGFPWTQRQVGPHQRVASGPRIGKNFVLRYTALVTKDQVVRRSHEHQIAVPTATDEGGMIVIGLEPSAANGQNVFNPDKEEVVLLTDEPKIKWDFTVLKGAHETPPWLVFSPPGPQQAGPFAKIEPSADDPFVLIGLGHNAEFRRYSYLITNDPKLRPGTSLRSKIAIDPQIDYLPPPPPPPPLPGDRQRPPHRGHSGR